MSSTLAPSVSEHAGSGPVSRDRPAIRTRRRRDVRWLVRRAALNATGILVVVGMGFPLYWMLNTAFKPGRQILTFDPVWFPTHPTLQNFVDAVQQPYFLSSLRNSVIVVVSTVVLAIVVAFLAAVAVSRFKFRGRRAALVLILIVQMIPLNALIIPLYLTLNQVGQTDQLTGVIVTYLTFVLPFSVWTLRGFVTNVPFDLEEAALVDGCSRWQAFWRVLFPLVAPGLVATSVFSFVQAWNEYLMAYVLISDQSKETATVWLASFTTSHGTAWGALMAGATLTAIPVVVFFLLVHRRMAEGLTAGAVKG